jgi:hypothetical protein
MEFNDKEKASAVKQQALQALHDENVRLGLYDGVYAIDILEQENRLLRARNDRLEKERTWVGLTLADKEEYLALDLGGSRLDAMDWADNRLKEKNT